MRPDESFIGQPIRSLQTMLRTIAQHKNEPTSLVPDGYYGQQTLSAVSRFQQSRGMPVTGITDLATWDEIVAVYEPMRICNYASRCLDLNLDPGQVINSGSSDPDLFLVQSVLTVLSIAYPGIREPTMSGTLDIPTAAAVSDFQRLSGLPVTGNIDRITWDHLALQYSMAARIAGCRKGVKNI